MTAVETLTSNINKLGYRVTVAQLFIAVHRQTATHSASLIRQLRISLQRFSRSTASHSRQQLFRSTTFLSGQLFKQQIFAGQPCSFFVCLSSLDNFATTIFSSRQLLFSFIALHRGTDTTKKTAANNKFALCG
jgi:hypothetical protein